MLLFNKYFYSMVFFSSLLLSFGVRSEYMIYGAYYACSEWNKEGGDNPTTSISENMRTLWLAGYMTAINQYSGRENFPDINASIASEYIRSYCKKNPEKYTVDGVIEMINKLKVKK
ncbi:hypothetical protein [Serratia marcescens]|uniref:hypothetical protein n=1 Tax=Serratia marcescens TaxID=615 RepID=UPI0027E57BE6|nr:hypothetical protein [Serratia marcescens]